MRTVPTISEHSASSDGAVVEVHIEGLAPGGDAVGRQQSGEGAGRATFVALGAPGDRIRARLTRTKARVAWGELLVVEQASPLRVTPPCPLFGRCGGCQWQHVDLQAQRAAKREIVARAVRLPVAEAEFLAPEEGMGGAEGFGYRERAQLVVGADGAIGFRARRSHEVVDVERCLLLAPAVQRALEGIRLERGHWPAGTEVDLQGGREGVHVAVRWPRGAQNAGARPGRGAVAAETNSLPADWAAAGIVGLRTMGPAGEAWSVGLADVDIAGAGEGALRISAGGFAQVGRAANQALLSVVREQVGENPGVVLELYAGSGNFTRALLERATRVHACDADRAAVGRGQMNAPAAQWTHRPPRQVDADTVLLDPPREGLDSENLAAALQARRRIVYVSCDPQTLGRDAARLVAAGFVLRRAVALDLMPHTYHVEVVATFQRG